MSRGSLSVEMPPNLEFVAVGRRDLAHVVDDQDLVGQIEHEVALVIRAREVQAHRFELEHQIVAERAVEAEMLVLGAGEQIRQNAQYRKQRGLAAALLLRKALRALGDPAIDPVGADVAETCRGQS